MASALSAGYAKKSNLNLAYRWFCHLGIHDHVPNHSTFSKNRHGRLRYSDAFRKLFESVLRRCIVEGLVGGEGFATDVSVGAANGELLPTGGLTLRKRERLSIMRASGIASGAV